MISRLSSGSRALVGLIVCLALLAWFHLLGHDDPFGVGEPSLPLLVSAKPGSPATAPADPGSRPTEPLIVDRSSTAATRSFTTAVRMCLWATWTLLVLCLVLATSLGSRLADRATRGGRSGWTALVSFVVLLLAAQAVLHLPLAILDGLLSSLVPPFSSTVLSVSSQSFLKDFGGLCVGTSIVIGQFVLLRRWPRAWWCIGWLVSCPLLIGAFWAHVYLLYQVGPSMKVEVIRRDGLHGKLRSLADSSGLAEVPIFLATGECPGRSVHAHVFDFWGHREIWIRHSTGKDMDELELLATFHHEAAHLKLRHSRTLALVLILASFGYHGLIFLLLRFLPSAGDRSELLLFPRIQAMGFAVLLVVVPAVLACHRSCEAEAERVTVESTRDGPGLARSWARLSRELDLDPYPNVVRRLWVMHTPSPAEYILFCGRQGRGR